jgi:hypothetical protein
MLLGFEDAHWIDPSSLEFLVFALDRARRLRVLILITARPEFALPGPNDAHIRRIVLGRMSRRESALLVLRITAPRSSFTRSRPDGSRDIGVLHAKNHRQRTAQRRRGVHCGFQ